MRKSLILFSFAGLLALSSCKYLEKHRLFSRDVDTLLDAEVSKPENNQLIDTTPIITEPTVAPVSQPVAKQVVFGYGSDKYYMIVGSFQNQNLAERYAEKIQKMGYQTQIIESSGSFYRVSAKSYSDFKTGISELEDFRSNVTSRAWLHVHK
jgi:hypothetical protein